MDGAQKIICDKGMINKFLVTRDNTVSLTNNLYPEDMVIQTEDYVSPTKWHLGHTTWFFENFLLVPFLKNYKIFSDDFNYIFNSYYNSVGTFNARNKRGFLNRPFLDEVMEYRKYVDENLLELFRKNQRASRKSLLEIGINHEQQHQELILMDIKNIFFSNPLKPRYNKKSSIKNETNFTKNSFILNNKKEIEYGWSKNTFCYDNELPSNTSHLEPFALTNYVTNLEWKEFIRDGGYNSHQFWLSDGWDYINRNNISKPEYWLDKNYYFTLNGVQKIQDSLPVCHISFYEACAYAKYKKLRLPTEIEIEYFLSKSKIKGNFLDKKEYQEIDYCNSSNFKSLYGNLWMWTSSNYVPYKNYKSYENNLMEYNSKFMCNQFVLKGGSFGTPQNHIRSSYRNFYYPYNRWQFCGLRLVSEL